MLDSQDQNFIEKTVEKKLDYALKEQLGKPSNDLRSQLETRINILNDYIGTVHDELEQQVNSVYASLSSSIKAVNDELTEFIGIQKRANRLNQAETRVVKIRQELDKKFGHYDIVRRTTQGILQADDLALVRKSTINSTTEELFITTPNYWLAPCLVALSAWINNAQDLAQKAVKEAVRRDDEKTSLFFAIICRRANRMPASLKWVRRYLAQQDETHLNRHAIVILDGLVCGLWGIDSENVISAQFDEWLQRLEATSNFTESQISAWVKAIESWTDPLDSKKYPVMSEQSPTWNTLRSNLEHAKLHDIVLNHFKAIMDRREAIGDTIQILDECLNNLVTNFDDEEIPLRKEEMLENLIIKYDGNEKIAQSKMEVEKQVFDEDKNYMDLLLEAAFNPETTHASAATCKFAIAVCKNYILDAHNDITVKYRFEIPADIVLVFQPTTLTFNSLPFSANLSANLPKYECKTQDGKNEETVIADIASWVKQQQDEAIKKALDMIKTSRIVLFILLGIVALISLIVGITSSLSGLVFFVAAVLGIVAGIFYYKHETASCQTAIQNSFAALQQKMESTTKSFCAEAVDYRSEFATEDAKSSVVNDYLETLVPNEYIHIHSERRRIRNHG